MKAGDGRNILDQDGDAIGAIGGGGRQPEKNQNRQRQQGTTAG